MVRPTYVRAYIYNILERDAAAVFVVYMYIRMLYTDSSRHAVRSYSKHNIIRWYMRTLNETGKLHRNVRKISVGLRV